MSTIPKVSLTTGLGPPQPIASLALAPWASSGHEAHTKTATCAERVAQRGTQATAPLKPHGSHMRTFKHMLSSRPQER